MTYVIPEPPKPVGYWILYAQTCPHMSFAMYHKPSVVQIWFTTKLLGWAWKDAG
jgi:hypothetical protein